nr:AraC family transcriptional regulator [Micromonospora sp. DSM 115978]
HQAAWIPAGTVHRSTWANAKVVSVSFDPAMNLPAGDRVRVLAAAPVLREMILYSTRWPASRTSPDPMADTFFGALGYLVAAWLDHEHEAPLRLPTTNDPFVSSIMKYTNDHLVDVSLPQVCAAVGASERTVRRAFLAATGMSWRRYLLESRILRAMTLLAEDVQNKNVIAIAVAVGFQSVSAFTRAFNRYTGQTPTAYRRSATARSS